MDFSFHYYNSLAETGIMMSLERVLGTLTAPPVVLCIGSDLAVGDSLGPIVGTLVKQSVFPPSAYVYGTLKTPITAKEMKYVNDFLRKTHPNSKIIAVDAALGEEEDVGLVKVTSLPLRPGSGANKRLGKVGDVSILGIVAKKTAFSYSSLNLTRLNLVYSMASLISSSLSSLINEQIRFSFTNSERKTQLD
ncbi:MAG: spore protease YyaC [Clostridia bacterium]|nr:spore protease YyaC [Clostridia bacterium]